MLQYRQVQAQDEKVSTSHNSAQAPTANYRELFQLGSGGFATISVALAQGIEGFSKLVVLKALREELSLEHGLAKMFLDEARLMARMSHPNIAQVYEVFRRGKAVVIVMEYVDGQPLSTVRARRRETDSPLNLDLGISILIKVLAALHYTHALCDFSGEPLGLIHRDISPQNVMVTYDGQVKLLDFGIAKLANGQFANADTTRVGVLKGKLTYMAPEQLTGTVDHRADIFAVGVMLWELAAQRRFWAQLPESTIIQRLIAGDLPHLDERLAVDRDLSAICEKALSHKVELRYANAAAMQEALEQYLTQRGIVVSQAAIGQFVSERYADTRSKVQEAIRAHMSEIGLTSLAGTYDAQLGDRSLPPPNVAHSGFRRRSRSKIMAIMGVGTAVVLVFCVGYFRHDEPSPPTAPGNAQPSGTTTAFARLRASAQPAGAVWYLDDRRLGPDPLDTRLPKDDAAHLLRAEVEGYLPFTRAIRLEADMEFVAVLTRKTLQVAQSIEARPSLLRRLIPSARAAINHVSSAPPVAAAPAPTPASTPPPTPESTKPKEENRPPQFGESLKRSVAKANRERPAIDSNYPGGGG